MDTKARISCSIVHGSILINFFFCISTLHFHSPFNISMPSTVDHKLSALSICSFSSVVLVIEPNISFSAIRARDTREVGRSSHYGRISFCCTLGPFSLSKCSLAKLL